MKKKNVKLPTAEARSQMIAFSWSSQDAGKILPWVNVNGEWILQNALPAHFPVEISLTGDCLNISKSVCN